MKTLQNFQARAAADSIISNLLGLISRPNARNIAISNQKRQRNNLSISCKLISFSAFVFLPSAHALNRHFVLC